MTSPHGSQVEPPHRSSHGSQAEPKHGSPQASPRESPHASPRESAQASPRESAHGSPPEPADVPPAWLRVFTEVARRGSFTAAGAALGYTQSAVSRQISALEAQSGAPLFDRLPRGVRLTEAGETLLPHAEAVLGRLAAARRDLAALRDLTAGRVRVGAFATAQASLLPGAVAAFRDRHPRVTVGVQEGPTASLGRRLAAGDLDVAVVSTTGAAALDGLALVPLLDDHMLVALPGGHRLAGAAALRLADLADEEWIASSTRVEDTLMAPCLRVGFQPRISLVVADWLAKLGFVAGGLGVTLVPSLAVGAVRPDIALVPLRPGEIPVREVYAATSRDLHRTAAVSAFLDALAETAAAHGKRSGTRRRVQPPGP